MRSPKIANAPSAATLENGARTSCVGPVFPGLPPRSQSHAEAAGKPGQTGRGPTQARFPRLAARASRAQIQRPAPHAARRPRVGLPFPLSRRVLIQRCVSRKGCSPFSAGATALELMPPPSLPPRRAVRTHNAALDAQPAPTVRRCEELSPGSALDGLAAGGAAQAPFSQPATASNSAPRGGEPVGDVELPLNWKAVPSHSRPGQMSYVHEPSGLKQSNVPTGEPSEEAIEAFRDAIATAKRKVTPLWRVLRGRARAAAAGYPWTPEGGVLPTIRGVLTCRPGTIILTLLCHPLTARLPPGYSPRKLLGPSPCSPTRTLQAGRSTYRAGPRRSGSGAIKMRQKNSTGRDDQGLRVSLVAKL